jgi:uncharacterized membrane protein YeaQ/YmgE (transglycosylase-associated protein family)
VDVTDLLFALAIGALTGTLGHLAMPHRLRVPLWFTVLAAVIAAVLASLVAGAIGVSETPGAEWAERTLQLVFALATVLNVRTLASLSRMSHRR